LVSGLNFSRNIEPIEIALPEKLTTV